MPYINKERRVDIDKGSTPETKGELSYLLTMLCLDFLEKGVDNTPWEYDALVDVVGVLDLTKAEFIRRVVVPYEVDKQAENGDVF